MEGIPTDISDHCDQNNFNENKYYLFSLYISLQKAQRCLL